MKCKYCRLEDARPIGMIGAGKICNEKLRFIVYVDEFGLVFTSDIGGTSCDQFAENIKIKYCPMCGRKLEAFNEHD